MPIATIILPVLNGYAMTRRCLASIEYNTRDVDYELIIIDDGSTDTTKSILTKPSRFRDRTTLISRSSNRGFGPSCNQGIKLASSDSKYIVITSNDIIVPDKWLSVCIHHLERNSEPIEVCDKIAKIGMISATPIEPMGRGPQPIHMEYTDYRQMHYQNSRITDNELQLDSRGGPWVFRKEVVDEVGLFDERFVPGNWEDNDYFLRMAEHGYIIAKTSDVMSYHFCSVTMEREFGNRTALEENRMRFIDKWGSDSITNISVLKDLR